MDRRKPILVNIGEEATDAALREAGRQHGVRVYPKVRVADVLRIERSGLSDDEFTYALKAHFDFVVVSEEDRRAYFAVEFDGPYHEDDKAAARDAKKNSICRRLGLPLLRINADFLRTFKGFTLVGWLIDLWFLGEAFAEAQAEGAIPHDEMVDQYSIIAPGAGGGISRPYDLAEDARRFICEEHERGFCRHPIPNVYHRYDEPRVLAIAMIPLANGRWIVSKVAIRLFDFGPVLPGDLADDLAVIDLAEKLEGVHRGETIPVSEEQLAAVDAELNSREWSGTSFSDDEAGA